jgi:hypothetical protein
MATGAARLECKGIHRKEKRKKRKTHLTHTGLLMEGSNARESTGRKREKREKHT